MKNYLMKFLLCGIAVLSMVACKNKGSKPNKILPTEAAYIGLGGIGSHFDQWNDKDKHWHLALASFKEKKNRGVAFVLNNEVYVGLGYDDGKNSKDDFYKWDENTKLWKSQHCFHEISTSKIWQRSFCT